MRVAGALIELDVIVERIDQAAHVTLLINEQINLVKNFKYF